MRTIMLLKGVPGCGKSTWAREQLQRYPGKYKRINKDDLRAMLDSDEYSPKNEKIVLDIRNFIAEKALMKGFDVIVDDTNFHNKHWEAMCAIAKRIGDVRVMEKFFECPLDEALKRNAARERKVPEGIVKKFFNDYVKGKHVEVRDAYFPKKDFDTRITVDTTKKRAIITDMDGTLSIATNRSYYDLTMVLNDTPNRPICDLIKLFKNYGHYIIVVSGRAGVCQKDTETWLEVHDIPYDALYLRNEGDSRKDAVIKEEIYRKFIEPNYSIMYVLDDRNSVVSMWRDIGLTCLQVNFGEF